MVVVAMIAVVRVTLVMIMLAMMLTIYGNHAGLCFGSLYPILRLSFYLSGGMGGGGGRGE